MPPTAKLYLNPNVQNLGKTDPIRVCLAEAGWIWTEESSVSADEAKKLGGNQTNNFPMLQCEGQYFTQQTAIMRFIGRKSGLYPVNTATLADIGAAADIDTLISCCEDLVGLIAGPQFRRAKTEAEKLEIGASHQPGVVRHLQNFQRLLGTKATFAPPKLTIADLAVYNALSLAKQAVPTTFAETQFAPLATFQRLIEQRPNIAKWLSGATSVAAAPKADAGAAAPQGPVDWSGLLAEAGLSGEPITLDCSLAVLAAANVEGRTAVLSALKAHGVAKLGDRQKLAGAISKAIRAGRELVDAKTATSGSGADGAVEEVQASTEALAAVDIGDEADASTPPPLPSEPLTLYYWPSHGRGEMVRLLLSEAGLAWTQPSWAPVEDEEKKLAYFAECRKLGGHLTTNLPLLHMDGRYVTQTASLLRYIGRRIGLYPCRVETPADILACHRIDQLIAAADDLRDLNYSAAAGISITRLMYSKTHVHPHLANFARLLGDGPYFSGTDAPTVADFTVYDVLVVAEKQVPGLLGGYPTLRQFRDRVATRPAVAKWNASEMKAQQQAEQQPVVNPDGSAVKPEWEPSM